MPSELTVHTVRQGRVELAFKLSEPQICPVWAMLKAGTPVSSSFTIVAG